MIRRTEHFRSPIAASAAPACAAVFAAVFAAAFALIGCGGGHSHPNPPPPGGPAAHGPVVVYPSTVSVPIGGTVDFSAYLPSQPSNTSFTWAVGGSDSGAVTAAGVYTAPASIPSPAQVVVTATGQGQTGTAVVTVTAAQGLAVSPAATAIAAGATVQFTATSSGQAVTPTWQVTGPRQGVNYGSIDANGNYTAPVTPPAGSSATITATSGALAGTATVQIQFANATFKGQYAFSFSGSDNSNEFFSVAGSFTADGAGNLTNGLDDFNAFASSGVVSSAQPAAFTGAYSIGPDGRGTITIANGSLSPSGSDTLQVALVSGQHGLIELFDSASDPNSSGFAATGSGSIDLQNAANFTLASITNHYAVQLSGLDPAGSQVGIVGRLFTSGGSIPGASSVLDINDTTAQTPDDNDPGVTGSYTLDTVNTGFGRGTLVLNCSSCTSQQYFGQGTLTFAFYVVDSTHLKLIETDAIGSLTGDAFAAPTPGNFISVPTGPYAFTVGGAENNGQNQPYALGGVFVVGASSGISTGVLDEMEASTLSQNGAAINGQGAQLNGGTGQIQLTISTATVLKRFVGYFAGSNAGVTSIVLLEIDPNSFGTGVAYPQTASVTPQGSFAVNLTGVANSSLTEQDIGGAFSVASDGSLAGALDINNAVKTGATSPNALVVRGSSLPAVGANGRGAPLVLTTSAPSATFSLSYYVIDANTALLLETDGSRVMTGTISRQF